VSIKRTAVIIVLPPTMVGMPRNANVKSVVAEQQIATYQRGRCPLLKMPLNRKIKFEVFFDRAL